MGNQADRAVLLLHRSGLLCAHGFSLVQRARQRGAPRVAAPSLSWGTPSASKQGAAAETDGLAKEGCQRARRPHARAVTPGAARAQVWFARQFPAYTPNSLLVDNALATMGAGLPSAIAAKIVRPTHLVLAVVGDGGYMMASHVRRPRLGPVSSACALPGRLACSRSWGSVQPCCCTWVLVTACQQAVFVDIP